MKKSSKCGVAGFVVLVVVRTCLGGGVDRPIENVATVSTRLLAPGRYARLRCDSDGNVYLRVDTGDRRSPVVRVSHDGKTLTTFSTDTDPDLSGVQDFWVNDYNDVFVLGEKGRDEGYVFSYDADAKLKGEVRVDMPIRPNQIAVFSSGDLLIAGREPVSDTSRRNFANGAPFVGIFNSRGQLIKRIELQKDIKPNPKRPLLHADLDYAEEVVNSSTISSDDGNVYFMRRGPTGPIYAISSAGTVTKTMRLVPPRGAVKLSTAKVARGTLAAEFILNRLDSGLEGPSPVDSVITQIYNLNTGKMMTEYKSVPPIGPDLACYDANSFKYLTVDSDYYLQILETEGR